VPLKNEPTVPLSGWPSAPVPTATYAGNDVAGRIDAGDRIVQAAFLGRGGSIVVGDRRGVRRRDREGEGVRRLVEVEAAIGDAAVILHLEGEARAAGFRRRRVDQKPGDDIGCRNGIAGVHRIVVIGERAGARQGRDRYRQQRVGVGIGEAEVGRRERVGRTHGDVDRVVGARRRVVDRGDGDFLDNSRTVGIAVVDGDRDRAQAPGDWFVVENVIDCRTVCHSARVAEPLSANTSGAAVVSVMPNCGVKPSTSPACSPPVMVTLALSRLVSSRSLTVKPVSTAVGAPSSVKEGANADVATTGVGSLTPMVKAIWLAT
jgi:hypothetical protein